MSHFLDRLSFFNRVVDEFADGHGIVTREDRRWEDGYRKRWQHDKIVRSTHGANCTGSCSWKIYVKGGIVTWETQQTDYPRTRPELPNHEPRGCSRGASYSWYLYSGNRVKYPLIRSRLLKLWREARASMTPVAAWKSIVQDPAKRSAYVQKRGLGGFVRSTWDEVNEIIAAANAYTVKTYGPDRVFGFSPIPAMSMVSYAAGSRYLSLLGGVCMSFYDWYCDLPPASPQTWGEQTDVPESADWYNSGFLILWDRMSPKRARPMRIFIPRRATAAPRVSSSPPTIPRPRNSPTFGCIPSRAPTLRSRWRWATSLPASSMSSARFPILPTTHANTPTCRCSSASSATTASWSPSGSCVRAISTER